MVGLILCRGMIPLFATMSTPAVWSSDPPFEEVPGAVSLGVKHLEHEADSHFAKRVWSFALTLPFYLDSVMLKFGNNFICVYLVSVLLTGKNQNKTVIWMSHGS
jgi:hypothetical protein